MKTAISGDLGGHTEEQACLTELRMLLINILQRKARHIVKHSRKKKISQ